MPDDLYVCSGCNFMVEEGRTHWRRARPGDTYINPQTGFVHSLRGWDDDPDAVEDPERYPPRSEQAIGVRLPGAAQDEEYVGLIDDIDYCARLDASQGEADDA